jgi:alpha-amylase
LTDRFARPNGDTSNCGNLSNYCGGGFRGIINNLDYIQGMGFDAIWISPIVTNTDGGYHGYWAKDWYGINPHFGSEQDLTDLVNALHSRGMWLMVDVVANHVAPIGTNLQGVGQINPFNQGYHYHSYCNINWNDQNSVENCWLADLPDLNQGNDYVRTTLLSWINGLVKKWNIDGLRIDTCLEVPKWFWTQFAQSAGVYTICECDNGDINQNAPYTQGVADATLNYPFYWVIRNSIMSGQSMYNFRNYIGASKAYKNLNWQGNFVDNHDNARFLSQNGNVNKFKTALALTAVWPGIPIVYYGDEQGYAGGNDPNNREPLWPNYHTSSDLYVFVKTIINYRKNLQLWNQAFVERYAADNFYAFSRGQALAAFTNSSGNVSYTVSYHPYSVGQVICNAFYSTDCQTVTSAGVAVYLANGEPKLYLPKSSLIELD